MERIALAREYRVAEWLRDAYLELTIQKETLDFEELDSELLPAEPHSNPLNRNLETDAKKWKEISRDWETLARISQLQTKVATSLTTDKYCPCCKCYGGSYYSKGLCKCRVLAMVDEAFWGELEALREDPPGHVEYPLTRKLPLLVSYLCR